MIFSKTSEKLALKLFDPVCKFGNLTQTCKTVSENFYNNGLSSFF